MTPTCPYGDRATVLGAGRSGMAAAQMLRGLDVEVFLSETSTIDPLARKKLQNIDVNFEEGGHTDRCLDADFVVISPGISPGIPLVRKAQRLGTPVVAEIEAASWFCQAPIVAVTGTNGKTTTTALLGHIFRSAKRPVFVAGNIGLPFSEVVRETTPGHVVVLEVSSFQLELIDTFCPRISLILNITPDHIDRHGSFSAYAEAKMRITKNQGATDTLIYGYDCQTTRRLVESHTANTGLRLLPFSTETELNRGAYLRDNNLIVRSNSSEEHLMQTEQVAIRGRHNVQNALAAALAGRVMEIRSEMLRESLTTFQGVPHRLELVREIDGVRYVNDSKATNTNALWFALESFREPVVLIAGGRDKGNDYSILRKLVTDKVRAVVGIGESGDKVLAEMGGWVDQGARAFTMEEAVKTAHHLAREGDVVLLSPACASFDMFEDYEDRGNTFKRLVHEL